MKIWKKNGGNSDDGSMGGKVLGIFRLYTKKARVFMHVWTVLLFALGFLFAAFPGAAMSVICFVIGAVILAGGVYQIVKYIQKIRKETEQADLVSAVLGVLLIVIGVYIVRHPSVLAAIAGILLGIFLLSYGLIGLARVLSLRAFGGVFRWLTLAVSAVTLVLGCLFLFSPVKSTQAVMRAAGVIFLFAAVISFLYGLRAKQYVNEAGEQIRNTVNAFEDAAAQQTGTDLYGKEIIDGSAEILPEDKTD